MVQSAVTASGIYEYCINLTAIQPALLINYSDKEKFDCLCKVGCANYNSKWSCPPYSPRVEDFISGWKHLYLMLICIEMKQFTHIRNSYLRIKAANSILKSRADKFLSVMAKHHGNYISNGSCRLCKPCKLKVNMPCAKPSQMTYSFEAMGVNVSKLTNDCFGKPLLWYTSQNVPLYTSVVSGLLTHDALSVNFLFKEYNNIILK